MSRTVEEYMNLPYSKTILPIDENEGGGFLVEVPELGRHATCAWGATEEEALYNLKQVMKSNIEMWLQEGLHIPEPKGKKNYSGAIALRVPQSMHESLSEYAASEGVSVNSLINTCIAEKIGMVKAKITAEIMHTHYYKIGSPDAFAPRAREREKDIPMLSDENIEKFYSQARVA